MSCNAISYDCILFDDCWIAYYFGLLQKENGTVGKEGGCETPPAFRWNFDEKKYLECEEDANQLSVREEDSDPDYSTVNEAVSS